MLKAEQAGTVSVEEDEREEPVRRADGEQVEQHRDERDDDRAERDREQDEAQPEHEEEHVRGRVRHGVEVVDVLGGDAADVDLRPTAAEDPRDEVRAKVAHRADRGAPDRVSPDRGRQQDGVPACRRLDRPDAEAPPGGQRPVEFHEPAMHRRGVSADGDDPHGSRVLHGEGALQQDEALLRGQARRQRADAVRADVEAEDRCGEREHRTGGDRERQRRPAQHSFHDTAPEAALRRVGAAEVPAQNRDRERIDAVADEAEQCGKQRQSRGDRDDADEDRPERQAPQDRGRDDEHPGQRDDERAAAEEHGTARRGAGERDRLVFGKPEISLLSVTGHDEQRIVDPESQPHPGEHVHDEDRERELERDHGDEPERDNDRQDRHQHGHEPGDDGREDENEDDERGREAERELALLEIRLRLLAEVVAGGVVAGDADFERAAVRLLHDLLDGAGARIAADVHGDEGRMTVGRDGDRSCAPHLSGRTKLGGQLLAEGAEPRRADVVPARGDDDHVLLLARDLSGERPGDRVLRLRRLRIAFDIPLRAQPVQRGRHEREGDQYRSPPERERQARTRRAPPSQPLGQTHGGVLTPR